MWFAGEQVRVDALAAVQAQLASTDTLLADVASAQLEIEACLPGHAASSLHALPELSADSADNPNHEVPAEQDFEQKPFPEACENQHAMPAEQEFEQDTFPAAHADQRAMPAELNTETEQVALPAEAAVPAEGALPGSFYSSPGNHSCGLVDYSKFDSIGDSVGNSLLESNEEEGGAHPSDCCCDDCRATFANALLPEPEAGDTNHDQVFTVPCSYGFTPFVPLENGDTWLSRAQLDSTRAQSGKAAQPSPAKNGSASPLPAMMMELHDAMVSNDTSLGELLCLLFLAVLLLIWYST